MTGTGTLIFLDTETTSLNPWRRVWELGAIIRRIAAPERRLHRFVAAEDLDLGRADLFSLNIGGYYSRYPSGRGDGSLPAGSELHSEADMLAEFAHLARGAHLVGNVVNFDADVLDQRMRAHGILPAWHYHLIDVEALAVGCLAGQIDHPVPSDPAQKLPWDSEEISKALGVDPSKYDRHTALGDAEWARDLYDAVMGQHG
jgi:DNA polymerase III epsilon subunit-like protein